MPRVALHTRVLPNYGTILQAACLYHCISSLGYECEIITSNAFLKMRTIDKTFYSGKSGLLSKAISKIAFWQNENTGSPPPSKQKLFEVSLACELLKVCNFSQIVKLVGKRRILTPEEQAYYAAYVCGSDQIWKAFDWYFNDGYFLDFAPLGKRIAYAPCIGGQSRFQTQEIKNIPRWRHLVSKIDYISCREDHGAELIKSFTGRNASVVLDPSLLISAELFDQIPWNPLLANGLRPFISSKSPYLLAYLLDSNETTKKLIKKIAARRNMEIAWLVGRGEANHKSVNVYGTNAAGFATLARNASFICTDGYHGTCMAIRFEKPFFCIRDSGSDIRVPDLLARLGVLDRYITPASNSETFELAVDFPNLNRLLEKERQTSWDFLRNSLERAVTLDAISVPSTPPVTVRPKAKRIPPPDPNSCTGCGACFNLCPANAITMDANKDGFIMPLVNNEQCTSCGLCLKRCPAVERPKVKRKHSGKCYAVWSKDYYTLIKSASGGAFSLFCRWMFLQKGVVFGMALDEDFSVHTQRANNTDELTRIHGSKYVQGATGKTYTEVGELLSKGRRVLYSGTSCQIAGLYGYLGGDHKNLLTLDLICLGAPSPLLFQKYIDWRQRQYKSKLKEFYFRSKHKGWSNLTIRMVFENGLKLGIPLREDDYGILFFSRNYLLPSCGKCAYRSANKRIADVTLGDFWSLGRLEKFPHQTEQGVSAVLPNSLKGATIWDEIRSTNPDIAHYERTVSELVKGNGPMTDTTLPVNPFREKMFSAFREKKFEDAMDELYGTSNIRTQIIPERLVADI